MAYSEFYYMNYVEDEDVIDEELWDKIIKNLRILKEEGVGKGTDQASPGFWDGMYSVDPHTVIPPDDVNDLITDILYLANDGLPPEDKRKSPDPWKNIDLPVEDQPVWSALMNRMINNVQLLALQKIWITETISESISVEVPYPQPINQIITVQPANRRTQAIDQKAIPQSANRRTQTITQTVSIIQKRWFIQTITETTSVSTPSPKTQTITQTISISVS